MTSSWQNHIRLGINHHLLFPQSFESAEVHRRTLPIVLNRHEFEVVDLFIPNEEIAEEEISLVQASGKEPVYNCPLMIGEHLNPHSSDPAIVRNTLAEARRHIDRAKRVGSRKMVVASGVDPGAELRAVETERYVDYMMQLCDYAGPGLCLLIEPFDRSIGKRLLVGPTSEAVAVVNTIKRSGFDHVGILMDMGHVPLMEETFRHAVSTAAAHIRHVHLGSCVRRNKQDPLYGDMHPPWGYPGGENDVKETAEFLNCLKHIGYLSADDRPTVTLEMRPYPDKTEVESLDIFLQKLHASWDLATGELPI